MKVIYHIGIIPEKKNETKFKVCVRVNKICQKFDYGLAGLEEIYRRFYELVE